VAVRKRNVPIARIVPAVKRMPNKTRLGCGKGTGTLHGDPMEPFIPEADWNMLEAQRLEHAARNVLTAEDTEVFVSPISAAEIACGVERGRIRLDRHWKPWFRHFLELNGWRTGVFWTTPT
jgi:hypothetical protein